MQSRDLSAAPPNDRHAALACWGAREAPAPPELPRLMSPPERVLLDARLAIRGLGIATWIDRLMSGFSGSPGARPVLWRASARWGGAGMAGTLLRAGLFDLSPEVET